MLKISVTQRLGESIKSLRHEYKIKAIDLADAINKSGAYITKLEKGDMVSIDYYELKSILKLIVGGETFLNNAIEYLVDKNKDIYIDNNYVNELWLINLDTVTRKMNIPKPLIEYIINNTIKKNVSLSKLINHINQISDLKYNQFQNLDIKFFNNFWFSFQDQLYFLNYLDLSTIKNLLNDPDPISNYMSIFSIICGLLELDGYTSLDAKHEATNILNDFNFLSLFEKIKLENSMKASFEINNNLVSFENNNLTVLNNIIKQLKSLEEQDNNYVYSKINVLNNNFEHDPALTIAYLGLDLTRLKFNSTEEKRIFIKELDDVISQYVNRNENSKGIDFI